MRFDPNLAILRKIVILFGSTQFFGLYIARQLLPRLEPSLTKDISNFSIGDAVILAVAVIFIYFLSSKLPRLSTFLYKIFLTIIIFSTAEMILAIWLSPNLAFLTASVLVFAFWFWQTVLVQDLVMLLTLAGIGALFGLALTPLTAVYILVIMSFYDIIAVYKTGHMIKLAEMMVQSRAIFGFVIPSLITDFKSSMKTVQPGEQFMILGSGDVVLPLILSASLVRTSLTQSIIIAIFSIFGLLVMNYLFANQKIRRPMAALPPIAAASILGYLFVLILL